MEVPLEQEAREILEAFRKVCVNKTPGPGFERTLAAIIELVKKGQRELLDELVRPIGEAEPTEYQVAGRVYDARYALHPTDSQTKEGE